MSEGEMILDATRIRTEREKRAWTQEQLAEIAGLGLRTVQRIESTGVASFESAASLSSALSIPVSELKANHASRDAKAPIDSTFNSPFKPSWPTHIWSVLAALFIAAILSPPRWTVLFAMWSGLWIAFEIGIVVASKRRPA